MEGISGALPIVFALAFVLATGVLLFLVPPARGKRAEASTALNATTFLLDGDKIIDHDITRAKMHLVESAGLKTWQDLRHWLHPVFVGLPETLTEVKPRETLTFPASTESGDRGSFLKVCAVRGGRFRVTLEDRWRPSAAERHEARKALVQRSVLEAAAELSDCPTCVLDPEDRIIWRNLAFNRFTRAQEDLILSDLPEPGERTRKPLALDDPETGTTSHHEPKIVLHRQARILFAADVTRRVRSDSVRGAFIQTLTKTFADLATGLAVFDRSRQLVLFNPALIDLTGLPPEFLTGKPGLLEFFDNLRNLQVLPEPKSYADWRTQIDRMISFASEGQYCESWYLPNGLTYRITGHPHPDGAVAFLIEDVTDQVALTQRYRAQIDTRQAVLDGLSEAIAVIGQNDALVFTNRAFNRIIGYDPDTRLSETRLDTVLEICGNRFPDREFWESVREKLNKADERPRLRKRLRGTMECRLEPLPGRFVLLGLLDHQIAQLQPA